MSGAGRAPRRGLTRVAFSIGLLALGSALSCTGGRGGAPAPRTSATRPYVIAVLGGTESLASSLDDPLREGWTQVALATALPDGSALVNLSATDATVEDAHHGLAVAASVAPTHVVVWLGDGDAKAGTTADAFATGLRSLLGEINAQHARPIFVAAATSALDPTVREVAQAASVPLVDVADLGGTFGANEHAEIARRISALITAGGPPA